MDKRLRIFFERRLAPFLAPGEMVVYNEGKHPIALIVEIARSIADEINGLFKGSAIVNMSIMIIIHMIVPIFYVFSFGLVPLALYCRQRVVVTDSRIIFMDWFGMKVTAFRIKDLVLTEIQAVPVIPCGHLRFIDSASVEHRIGYLKDIDLLARIVAARRT